MKTVKSQCVSKSSSAFTVLELVAIVIVLAVWASLLVTAMARTKPGSQNIQCLNNMRQLMEAMTMYTHDHFELFPPNPDDGTTQPAYSWVEQGASGWMPSIAAGGAITAGNPDLLKSRDTSLLARYLGGKVGAFKCPTDPRIAPYSGSDTNLAGQNIPVVRSVSMNQGVGTIDPVWAAGGPHAGRPSLPVNGPWLDGNHTHHAGQPYATFGKMTDFKNVGPSAIWVFVDDDPWTINDGAMAVIAATPQLIDYCSPFHSNGTGFAFGDSHAELHRWQSNLWIHNGVPPRTMALPGAQYNDWFWWASHATRSTVTQTVP